MDSKPILFVFLLVIVIIFFTFFISKQLDIIDSYLFILEILIPVTIVFFTYNGIAILIKKYPFLKFPMLIGIPLFIIFLIVHFFAD